MRRWTSKALVIAMIVVGLGGAGRPAGAGGPTVGATYVALGDSYAAGEGLGPFEDGTAVDPSPATHNLNVLKNTCHRSLHDAYGSISPSNPVVLPSLPDSARANWACSGARTTDMTAAQDSYALYSDYYQYDQPAQTGTVSDATKWISLSAGGNDLEFSKIGMACAVAVIGGVRVVRLPDEPDCRTLVDSENAKLPQLASNLTNLYETLLGNAPSAVLAVVGYPRIFPTDYSQASTPPGTNEPICITNTVTTVLTGTLVSVGVPVSDAKAIDAEIIQGLNSTAKSVVDDLASMPQYAGRIVFADTYDDPNIVPQNCTGDTPDLSVNGVVLSPGFNGLSGSVFKRAVSSATFHPTKAGQAVMGQAVQDAFASTFLRYTAGPVTVTGKTGDAVSASTMFTAGVPPFATYVGLDGQPPQWLSLGLQGRTITLSGTAAQAGSWSFNVIVSDAHDDTITIPVTVTVTSPLPPSYWQPAATISITNDGPISGGPARAECMDSPPSLAPSPCVVQTAFGYVSNSEVEMSGSSKFVPVSPSIGGIPSSNTIITGDNSPPYGYYALFTENFPGAITPVYSLLPPFDLIQYKINRSPDAELVDENGKAMAIDGLSEGFSSNGQWMVADSPFVSMVRENLETFQSFKFGLPTDYSLGEAPNYRTAISDDGRYVAVNAPYGTGGLSVEDLNKCTPPAPGQVFNNYVVTGNQCQTIQLGPAIQAALPGYTVAIPWRFVDDHTLLVHAGYVDASGNHHTDELMITSSGS